MACSLYEAAELTASCPVSDDETARVSEVVTNWNPELLLLLLSGGAVVQEGANFFELVRRNRWRVPVVVVCPPVKPHDRIELLRLGASEVLSMPLQLQEVIPRLLTVHRRADQDKSSVAQLRAALGLEHVIGESPAFVALIKQIPPIAKYDVSVLSRERSVQEMISSCTNNATSATRVSVKRGISRRLREIPANDGGTGSGRPRQRR